MLRYFLPLIISLTLIFCRAINVNGQQTPVLSNSAYITVFTCAPGTQLYSTFGHSAIGVFDPENGLELVYNYGTFSFQEPNFYVKFASGKLNYQLSRGNHRRFLHEYITEGRLVTSHVLNLTQQQTQALFNALAENNKPENRYYQYDFFFDNCATRILDMLYTTLADSLVFVEKNTVYTGTYRAYLHQYLNKNYWNRFGIDLILGSVIDKPASPRQAAFLPDYLKLYIENCTIGNRPLVKESYVAVPASLQIPKTPWFLMPYFIFWIFAFAVIAFTIIFKHANWVITDRVIFGFFGFLGLIVLLLWVATDHDATAGNYNVVWCNVIYIIYACLIGSRFVKTQIVLTYIFIVFNALILSLWWWLPQSFNPAFIPLIVLLIVRLVHRARQCKLYL